MKMERRSFGVILVSENQEESKILDEVFGTKVADDGLIGSSTCECRLSDGYGEHYVSILTDKKLK